MMHPKVFTYREGNTQNYGDQARNQGKPGSHFGLIFPELAPSLSYSLLIHASLFPWL